MLGKSPAKWRQCPDVIIAVDWGAEPLEGVLAYKIGMYVPPYVKKKGA